ncbi:Uma2 family endonuclease [Runella salmonicolor]|uniref:Uma2 family endonuclease n=1 Tax=Runella salmonicolor TaxID=2950278 RepID=A0ABT1FQC1_9BACT|nr:Uma2 family endonuclease [Runella salmonicolor]MCP1383961.1 Uma2 family endonuclease [Runella salmonicolor]
METIAEKTYSVEEYFAFCEQNAGRFEYVNGAIIEMSGESVTANQIAGNIHFYLRGLLEDQPFIFVQNAVKLQVKEGKAFRIPDFFIFHESGNQKKYATEPVFIVEVLSESSINTDRVTKLAEYTQIPTLQYYLIIEQEECLVEVFNREGKRWYVDFYSDLKETIDLPALNVKLPLSVVYKKINLPAASSPSE